MVIRHSVKPGFSIFKLKNVEAGFGAIRILFRTVSGILK
jgi:hypothetical protein